MKRFNYKRYFLFGLLVLFVVSMPVAFVDSLRCRLTRMIFPLWQGADKILGLQKKENLERLHRLEIENHLLRIEIGKLLAEIEKKQSLESIGREVSTEKKESDLNQLLKTLHSSITAHVIYRDPGAWGSSFWINVGEDTNQQLGKRIIKKNSPVLYGRSIVGAIDYVGKKQSKVRLITDSAIKPSVRVARGRPQNLFLRDSIDTLLRHLNARNDLSSESDQLVKELKAFKEELSTDGDTLYLAKGILQGAKSSFCRSLCLLWGVGFNYDFDDKEGPARDLISKDPQVPLLKMGDLLITTGMDGVFPAGLRVAEITRINPLKEGDYTFEIEANPSIGNLDDLTTVFVIAPLGFDPEEKIERILPNRS